MTGQKVLIADDSAQIRMMVRDALSGCDYAFVEAADGEQALELAIAERPDLVLLDLTMPGLDGFEVLQFLRQRPETERTRIIALTGSEAAANEDFVESLGAIGYIVKPFDADQLRDAVAEVLGLCEAERRLLGSGPVGS